MASKQVALLLLSVGAFAQNATDKWSLRLSDGEQGISGTPSVGADGSIYVSLAEGFLVAVNGSGEVTWKFQTAKALDANATAWADQTIAADGTIIATHHRSEYAFTLSAIHPNGTAKWVKTFQGWGGAPVTGPDGSVYLRIISDSDAGCSLHALDSEGNERWVRNFGRQFMSSENQVVAADGTIFISVNRTEVIALGPDGVQKWNASARALGDDVCALAVASDGTVYTSELGHLEAWSQNGTRRWEFPTGSQLDAAAAIGVDGTVYIGSLGETLYALKPDGSLKWSFHGPDWFLSTPAISSDGMIYIATRDGHLLAVDSEGKQRWYRTYGFETGSTGAVVASDGSIYMAVNDTLHALQPPTTNPNVIV